MAHPTELDALYALLVAAAVTALLTPLTMRLARRLGDDRRTARARSLERPTPLLGGLAIFGGVLVAALCFLPAGYAEEPHLWNGVLLGAAMITLGRGARRPLRPAPAAEARRPDPGGGRRRALRRGREVDHAAVRRAHRAAERGHHQRRPAADGARAGGDDERRQLLRRRRRPRGGGVRDHRRDDGDHRLRPRPSPAGRAGGADGRRGARLPDLQLPAGEELHGRRRRQPARPADGRDRGRGGRQDAPPWCRSCCR